MSVRPKRKLTYDDYARLPDDEPWELIDGEAYMAPAPNVRHQEIAYYLAWLIRTHVETQGGGRAFIAPVDAVLTKFDVVQPDIFFVSDEDLEVITDANVKGSPTWVIEILSDRSRENLKLVRYEAAGVREHWLVDPFENRIEVRRLRRSRYELVDTGDAVSPLVPRGLTIDVRDVFNR